MDPRTHLPDVAESAIGPRATRGNVGPRGSDDYQTDYAGYASTPVSDCPTNPARAGAGPRIGRLPSYPFLLPAVEPDEIGRIGNYRVLRLLGQGGMAFVFLAEDIALRRKVALKVMKPDCDGDLDGWQRFLREARIMASLKHEHLVTVFQVAQEGGVCYLAMELLEGETLDSWFTRVGQARPADIIRLARGIAAGLATIHRHGIVHRDIKPGNLWLEQPGDRIKILDLGLARAMADDARFTRSGIIVGTPAFMSPEQARAERIDPRSDLFSLGAVMYLLAAGRLPFDAPSTVGVLSALAVCKPVPVYEQNAALPRSLGKLIMQLLAKEPADRPASAEAVIAHLQRIETRYADTGAVPTDALEPPDMPRPNDRDTDAPPRPRGRSKKKRKPAPGFGAGRWKVIALAIAASVLVLVGISAAVTIGIIAWAGSARTQGSAKVFLNDLQPIEVVKLTMHEPKGPPMFEKGPPPPPKDFTHARVNDRDLPRGILMHPLPVPEGGFAKQSYRLGGKYATFHAEVTLNDGPVRSETAVTFTVLGDGQRLWQSAAVVSRTDRQTCTVSLKNVQVLTIQVECPGARGAHAVWVDPHVTP